MGHIGCSACAVPYRQIVFCCGVLESDIGIARLVIHNTKALRCRRFDLRPHVPTDGAWRLTPVILDCSKPAFKASAPALGRNRVLVPGLLIGDRLLISATGLLNRGIIYQHVRSLT